MNTYFIDLSLYLMCIARPGNKCINVCIKHIKPVKNEL